MRLAETIDIGTPVLAAVSGGADSVALLHILAEGGRDVVAAHCNFHLRGAESDRDEAFVRDLCGRMGVELLVTHFDTRSVAAERHVSIEMAARDLRYEWFGKILDERGIPCVAVAHHADDAAETMLLNMTRGTGPRGLTGMKTRQGRVVRPLLSMSREDIENYCKAKGLCYVSDSSNASDDFARNKIRHHVVPVLKAINPSFLATMRANASHMAGVMAVFEQAVRRFEAVSVRRNGATMRIDADALRATPDAKPYLFEILAPRGFSADAIARMAMCVSKGLSGKAFYADGLRAVVDRKEVIVHPIAATASATEARIDADTAEVWEPTHLRLRTFDVPPGFAPSRDAMRMHLDASKIAFPLTLRHWRAGDAFRPLGMRGSKKLSDFFVDSKTSLPRKDAATVLEDGDGAIVCIVGMRIDDRYKLTDATRRVLEVTLAADTE